MKLKKKEKEQNVFRVKLGRHASYYIRDFFTVDKTMIQFFLNNYIFAAK